MWQEDGGVSTSGPPASKLGEQRSSLNPSPSDVVQRVEGLFVDSTPTQHADRVTDHQLFASGTDPPNLHAGPDDRPSPHHVPLSSQIVRPLPQAAGGAFSSSQVAGTSRETPESQGAGEAQRAFSLQPFRVGSGVQGAGEQRRHTVMMSPAKGVGCAPEASQAAEQMDMPPGDPIPDAERRKANMSSLGTRMGYSEADVEETLLFFDFTRHDVRPAEFLCALDEVRTTRCKKEDGSGGGKDSSSPSKSADAASPHAPTASQRKKGPGQGGQKSGKGKQQGKVPSPSSASSPSKANKAAASTWKSVEIIDPLPPSHPGSPTSPANTSGTNLSRDDSVIFMGEELNNSVYILESSPVAAGPSRVTPPDRPVPAPRMAGCKRKEYSGSDSEDEEETCVLKPYPSSVLSDVPASRSNARQQTSGLPQNVGTTGAGKKKSSFFVCFQNLST